MLSFNLYCDESCHIQKDGFDIMVIGLICCPANIRKDVCRDIRAIKKKYFLPVNTEIKWIKVSNSKLEFYKELLNYFITNDELLFRGVVSTNKQMTNIKPYGTSYDDVYNKIYFYTFVPILNNLSNEYREQMNFNFYLDIKDTLGQRRINLLRECMQKHKFDNHYVKINKLAQINSRSSEILQLADLIIGAISYYNRYLSTNHKSAQLDNSEAKIELINMLLENGYRLEGSSNYAECKFNVFTHRPSLKYRR